MLLHRGIGSSGGKTEETCFFGLLGREGYLGGDSLEEVIDKRFFSSLRDKTTGEKTI